MPTKFVQLTADIVQRAAAATASPSPAFVTLYDMEGVVGRRPAMLLMLTMLPFVFSR